MKDLFKKPGYLLILIVVSIALSVFFIIMPLAGGIKESQTQITKVQSDINDSESKLESLKKISSDQTDTSEISTVVSNFWPDDKDLNNFILNLENLANSEGVTFTNLTISEPKTASASKKGGKKTYKTIEFSVESNGTYAQNISVIEKLESFNRFNTISSVSLSRKENGVVLTSITGSIYYGE